MVDALTIAGHVNSPVVLSESPLFRRKFSSVYDALVHGELGDELKSLFSDSQAADWETIGGYEIHAIDATPHERMAAETLADRGALKAQQKEPVRYGHKSSWLVRLVQSGTSWVAPEDIERIGTATTDTKVAAQQVKDLAVRDQRPKVITADSRYRDKHFWALLPLWRTPLLWCGYKTIRNSVRNRCQSREAAGVHRANMGQTSN